MTLPALLMNLGWAGVTLRAVGDGIGFVPRSALTPQRAEQLRMHRAAVMGLLVDGYAPAGDVDAGYILGERLGIADGLGMPTHPGSPAWLVAASEAMMHEEHLTRGKHDVDCTHADTAERNPRRD